ncbi:MAG: large-conductance mechanosensitive channel protein MscL [Oscillospiraceae bacterium]|jgi:large conductance mechanosensitive channel|nr:large-conductance mechanosensitive channel protein MscL [Oscillospiraceae bacterium]
MAKKPAILSEFKEFAVKGNMLDMAVGVIIGGAFKTVVDALTEKIIMPIVSMFPGGVSFESWKVALPQFFGERIDPETGAVMVNYLKFGDFISAIINFFIMAFVIFMIVKGMNRLRRKKEETPAPPPAPSAQELLLTEIRDLLREK